MSVRYEWASARHCSPTIARARDLYANEDSDHLAIVAGTCVIHGTPDELRAWLIEAMAALDAGEPVDTRETGVCIHCERAIVFDPDEGWFDPEAPSDKDEEGGWLDDAIWKFGCDRHDAFDACHEPA